jgi:hypothetical protein
MVPDTHLQLTVVIKALRDVVAPAVDPEDKLAVEQLHLSIATLSLVQSWLPLGHRRARRELLNAIDLADRVRSAGAEIGVHGHETAARASLENACADEAALDSVRVQLLAEIETAVAAASGGASERAVARAVIVGSRPQFDLARVMCQRAGFDLSSAELPSLDQLLTE